MAWSMAWSVILDVCWARMLYVVADGVDVITGSVYWSTACEFLTAICVVVNVDSMALAANLT